MLFGLGGGMTASQVQMCLVSLFQAPLTELGGVTAVLGLGGWEATLT